MADGATSAESRIEVIANDAQDFLEIDVPRWSDLVLAVLADEHAEGPMEVGLDFVDSSEMARLHEQHLGGHGPTDVLSFPVDDGTSAVPDGQVRLLGDVVVCTEVAARQAQAAGHDIEHEIAILIVHGVLHLVGYDHADAAQEAEMFGRQAELVRAHGPR